MELDWYHDKLSVDAVLTPQSSFRRMLSSTCSSPDRLGSPRWLALALNLMQGYSFSNEECYSTGGGSTPSPRKTQSNVVGGEGDSRCRRSLTGNGTRCLADSSSLSASSLSLTSSPGKPHICFGCVLHSHEELHVPVEEATALAMT